VPARRHANFAANAVFADEKSPRRSNKKEELFMRGSNQSRRGAYLGAFVALVAPAAATAQGAVQELPGVTVIGTTPLPGLGVPRDQVPANVQSFGDEDMRRQQSLHVADHLNRNVGAVFINEAQSNPFQPDVTFRGFAASPLLGNPIGMSVFVDGVRVNESFGDTVFWDLIPSAAIAGVDLIPGSNPVFGLNTLGGALSVRTKSGREDPGVAFEAAGGSFGRRSAQFSLGGRSGAFDGFIAANDYDEDGWRDRSPSRVQQLFGKAGWSSGGSALDLSYTYADNKLIGNGMVPESILAPRREAVYTYPDETKPRLDFFNLTGTHALSKDVVISGNVYSRRLKISTFNGDAEFEDNDTPTDITDDEYEAENRRTATDQRTLGAAVQVAFAGNLGAMKNQLTVGASIDRGKADFSQLEQEADFTADRGTVPDGDFELDTQVRGKNRYEGVYVTDTLGLTERAHLTLSGRYNRAKVEIEDLTGTQPELNGSHSFSRFNPAIGATFAVTPGITLFGGYNEGFRVPTPVELTCADPDAPCSLPVSFVADPPLEPVVARSWEFGARGRINAGLSWNATGFRTDLSDDILFTSVGAAQGFFANVTKTRRQGIELGMSGRADGFDWFANYAFVDATFESDVELFNPVANEADPSQPETINVSKGNKLPGIPRQRVKLGGDYRFADAFSIGASALYASSQYLRGDEANQLDQLPGYTIVNLRGEYRFAAGWRVFAKVDNVFDKKYSTIGALNRNAFDADSEPLEGVGPGPVERFVSPGQPRSYWIGIEYRN
jgi:outer membrane receptor protein involved in Fe transport